MDAAAQLASQTQLVLGLAFALAMLFGALTQRSHFCSMGALADLYTMGDATRARMFLLALGVAMAGFAGLVAGGWVDPAASHHTSSQLRWASLLLGGAVFGVGMVLASGCGAKTLVRLGGGNLKALVVWLVMGIAAQATLRGITAVPRVEWLDPLALTLPVRQDLPSLWLLAGWPGASWLGWGLGALCMALALWRSGGRWREVLPGGLGIGLLVVALWWVSGHVAFVPEHPQTLEPAYLASSARGMESFSFVAPAAYGLDWLTLYSDASRKLSLGVVIPVGLVLGAGVAARLHGSFRWEGFANRDDLVRHLVGAVLMGVGGVTALGCSIGQGLSGLSTLSVGSVLAVIGIVAGAWLGLHLQARQLEQRA